MGVSVKPAQQIQHFRGNILLYRALIDRAQGLRHMRFFLGGGATLAGGGSGFHTIFLVGGILRLAPFGRQSFRR